MPAEVVLPSEPTDGVPIPQRYWAVLTIWLGLTLAVLDGAIANVALPTIATDLHTSPSNSIWVINAYQLAVTISLLPLSSLGDIFGYRRVYQAGFIVFTIASLACAMSWSLPSLAIARAFQGFGAAGIMSVNSALVRFIYPRRWIGRGIGINSTISSVASAAGPSVATAILAVAPWPWLFAVNVPLGIAGAIIAWRALPATPSSGVKFDAASALMSAISLGLLITVIDGVGHGEHIELIIIQGMVAFVVGLILVARELSQSAPLLPVDLMRIPLFALSVTTSVCAFVAQAMALVSLPFLFESTLGFDQVRTGLLMTPWPLMVAVIAPFTGRPGRPLPCGHPQWCWADCDGPGPATGQSSAGASQRVRHCMAHGGVWPGLRVFQHAEQPCHHHRSTASTHRRCLGNAGGGASVRADHRGGPGGAGVRRGVAQRHDRDADLWRMYLHRGRWGQLPAVDGAVVLEADDIRCARILSL